MIILNNVDAVVRFTLDTQSLMMSTVKKSHETNVFVESCIITV